jgi:hypothetical protein
MAIIHGSYADIIIERGRRYRIWAGSGRGLRSYRRATCSCSGYGISFHQNWTNYVQRSSRPSRTAPVSTHCTSTLCAAYHRRQAHVVHSPLFLPPTTARVQLQSHAAPPTARPPPGQWQRTAMLMHIAECDGDFVGAKLTGSIGRLLPPPTNSTQKNMCALLCAFVIPL